MNKEHKLGIRTLCYYLYQRTLFGIVLLIIAVCLPSITRFFISVLDIPITQASAAVINQIGSLTMFGLLLLAFLVIVIGIIFSWLKYISMTYTLEDYAFKLRRGILSRAEISIPYKQIQDVNFDQSIFFRIFGLSNFIISSGGNDEMHKDGSASEVFPVIDNAIARRLREDLLKRSNIQQVEEVKQ